MTNGRQSPDEPSTPHTDAGSERAKKIAEGDEGENDVELTAIRNDAQPSLSPANQFRTVIEGGLVIPLYVFVLSIIGGAINMTRRLPAYQREAESLSVPFSLTFIKEVGSKVLKVGASVVPNVSHDAAAATDNREAQGGDGAERESVVNGSSEHAVSLADDGQKGSVPDAAAGTAPAAPTNAATDAAKDVSATKTESVALSAEQRTAEWREGLIMLHMYLISAPFLAIAVFYLLDWLDMRKKPLLVLVALSVGLVSDKILRAILGVVVPILERGATVETQTTSVKTS